MPIPFFFSFPISLKETLLLLLAVDRLLLGTHSQTYSVSFLFFKLRAPESTVGGAQ
jgi:hypothetical protein